MLSCEACLERMSAALDGPLSLEDRREMEEHLSACPACRTAWAALESMTDALREVGETPAPPELAAGVMARITREKTPVPLWKRPWWRSAAGLAACAVLCAGLYWGYAGDREPADTAAQPYAAALEPEQSGEPALRSLPPEEKTASVPESQADGGPRVSAALAAPPWGGGTALALDGLPEEAAALLPPLEEWTQEADGLRWCSVTAEELEAVCAALEEAGAEFQRPEEPWSEACAVLLAPEKTE